MDDRDRSIVAQVCVKASAEIYTSLADPSSGFQPDLLESIYRECWRLHSATVGTQQVPPTRAAPAAPPTPQPGPFAPPQPQQNVAPQPVPVSQPVAQPSQPQQVAAGPPCPVCQTPTVQTKDYYAKKARNLSEGKKAPPLWRCPMGSWTPQSGPQGCQGCLFEEAA